MKKIIFGLMLLQISACKYQEKGTVEHLGFDEKSGIEVYKYYYDHNEYVFVSKFKESQISTSTWPERKGKHTYTMGNIILENDSIVVIKK